MGRVLESASGSASDAVHLEAVLECCLGLLDEGYSTECLELLERAASRLAPLGGSDLLRLNSVRVRALFSLGRNEQCVREARLAREEQVGALRAEPKAATLLLIYEGAALGRTLRLQEAQDLLSSVRRDLLREPDSALLASCCFFLSALRIKTADWSGARELALETVVSATRADDKFWSGSGHLHVAIAERGRCRWIIAVEAATQARELFIAIGNAHQEAHARRTLAITQWKRGKLAEAHTEATACVEQASTSGHRVNHQYALELRALIEVHQGAFDAALADLKSARAELEPGETSRPALLSLEYLGDVHLEQARAESALEHYEQVWPRALALVPRGDIVAELRRRIAECHLLLGRPAKAVEWCEGSLEHCQELGDRYEEAATYRVLALAHAALGHHDQAKAAFDRGFAIYEEIETPYEWGKLWMAYGDWLRADDSGNYRNLSAAHEAYRVAIDHFEGMGAEYRLSQARARLEALDAQVQNDGEALVPAHGKVRPVRRPRHSAEVLRLSQWAFDSYGMVTRSRPLLDMLVELDAVAKSNLPVMVLGESGTGKELIAQGVHKLSGCIGRMVALNCSAIPASMLESEVFGHVKGSFTNALADKQGLFEVADRGTIFLDEIGEMSPDLQAKLLRVLELGIVRRIGGTEDVQVRSRVVAATNRDRLAMQTGQGFRSDLYYRLAHAVYELPPLRQRGDDTELLVEHFLRHFNAEHHKSVSLSKSARERLVTHPWPGNIRQLRSVLEKMVVSARPDATLTPRQVPLDESTTPATGMMAELDAEEARRIRKALADANNIKTAAAEILGISRTTLLGKMKRLGIEG